MIDARGLVCPAPVLMAQKELAGKPDTAEILVDNHAARENVSRFAAKAGYKVEVKEENGDYRLILTK